VQESVRERVCVCVCVCVCTYVCMAGQICVPVRNYPTKLDYED